MKNLVLMLVMICSFAFAQGQSKVVVDKTGNYITVKSNTVKSSDKATGKSFVDSKGVKYPVLKSVNGKLYYLKTAKSGNVYRVYIKVQ